MKPLKANEIVGNWAALLLPIDEDERIDYGRLQAELEVLTASGVNGHLLQRNSRRVLCAERTRIRNDQRHAGGSLRKAKHYV